MQESWKPLLPLARIKQLIKLDPSVNQVSQDFVYAITVSTQLFLELLTMEAYQFTLQQNRKTINYRDVSNAIADIHEFEFLTEIVPFVVPVEEALERREMLMEMRNEQNEHY